MTHDLLTGDLEPPGDWMVSIIGGTYISFRKPEQDGERHHVVIEKGGEHGDDREKRPVEVWTTDLPEGRILLNYKGDGETVGEGVGMTAGASIALEYMEENP